MHAPLLPPLFVVVGPPAVGKSTTSRALARRFTPSIHLPVDDLRHMVVSGQVLPGPEWSPALAQQLTLARTGMAHVAFAYRSAGFAVVIDDFLDPGFDADYRALLTHPQTHRVLLLPDEQIARQRNVQRAGPDGETAYIEAGIAALYCQIRSRLPNLLEAGWQVVDTTALDVEATVDAVLQHPSRES